MLGAASVGEECGHMETNGDTFIDKLDSIQTVQLTDVIKVTQLIPGWENPSICT